MSSLQRILITFYVTLTSIYIHIDLFYFSSVWDIYQDDLQEHKSQKRKLGAQKRALLSRLGLHAEAEQAEKLVAASMDEEENSMDPSMKAFRDLENKLRDG